MMIYYVQNININNHILKYILFIDRETYYNTLYTYLALGI